MAVADLEARVAELEADRLILRQQLASLSERYASADADAELIAAIAAEANRLPDLHFTSREVVHHAESVSAAFLLRATLHRVGAETAEKLGLRLRRLAGCVVAGYLVHRHDRVTGGMLWSLETHVGRSGPTSTG